MQFWIIPLFLNIKCYFHGLLHHYEAFILNKGNSWAAISAGGYHTIALNTEKQLMAWGSNQYGQLGNGTNISEITPTRIGTDADWAKVVAGYAFTVALRTDGTLWAWGGINYCQLGDGTNEDKTTPTPINAFTIYWKSDYSRRMLFAQKH